jgi:hypothetical protein
MSKRDWSAYNAALVREGSFFFSGKVLDSLRRFDVRTRKVGRPPYPNSLIILLAVIRTYFKLPYRQTEGLAKEVLSKLGVTTPSYATIDRRVRELTMPMDVDPQASSFELAIDSTGYKVSNRGDWMREKWKRKRGYVKLHVAVDVKTKKVIALEVTDESVGDTMKFESLLEKASSKGRVEKVYADAAYDARANFNRLYAMNAEAAIKPRKNASGKARGSYLRAQVVRVFLPDQEAWKKSVNYGTRWMVETCNSTMKRCLGEFVRAINGRQIVQEMRSKCLTYNLLTGWRRV